MKCQLFSRHKQRAVGKWQGKTGEAAGKFKCVALRCPIQEEQQVRKYQAILNHQYYLVTNFYVIFSLGRANASNAGRSRAFQNEEALPNHATRKSVGDENRETKAKTGRKSFSCIYIFFTLCANHAPFSVQFWRVGLEFAAEMLEMKLETNPGSNRARADCSASQHDTSSKLTNA